MNRHKIVWTTLATLALATIWTMFAMPVFAQSKKPLTNADVVQMVKAGFDEQTVVKAIQANGTHFDVSPQALVALKNSGVSQMIIQAMLSSATKENGATEEGGSAAGATESPSPAANPNDPKSLHAAGIYWEQTGGANTQMVALEPSTYSRGKLSGLFGEAMSMGISKAKWEVVVNGAHASLRIPEKAPEFWFYFGNSGSAFSSGPSSPSDFTLVKLESHGSNRELVVGKAGAFGASTGVPAKDTVNLRSKQIAPGIYEARPASPLKPGEYAFLPLGENMVLSSAGGKLFDFEVDAAR